MRLVVKLPSIFNVLIKERYYLIVKLILFAVSPSSSLSHCIQYTISKQSSLGLQLAGRCVEVAWLLELGMGISAGDRQFAKVLEP